MVNFKTIRDSAIRGAVFGSFAALFMGGAVFALTYNWTDPSTLRGKTSGNPLQSSQWNLLVGNVDNLNERLTSVESQGSVIPTGTIIAYNGTACPTGWTEAAGSAVPTGVGGSSTLDLRGEFVRGWDHGRGIDGSRTVLSSQNPTRIRNLIDNYSGYSNGTFSVSAWNIETLGGSNTVPEGTSTPNDVHSNTTYYQATAVASAGSGDNWAFATRPRNVALLYCVKN